MAGEVIHQLLRGKLQSHSAVSAGIRIISFFSSKKFHEDAGSVGMKSLKTFALLGAGVSGFLSFATIASTDEAENGLACPNYPWPYEGILS
ncbi:hypothetical protein Pint_21916 [Pistacia integerrima]|uniref:Uncharacterized protein n=1 Tax=Pistacia integerrima TaxID=434235 RepID=A0ACC0YL72_9ROSI|nr:hypothetical protein Pint_21916 [Pistacia integerrima]